MKKLKWVLLALVLLVIAATVGVYLSLDGIIRSTVQSQASSSLNLATTLGSADVSVFGGSLSLKNLEVSSPPGFSAPQMFSLGDIDLLVRYGELRKDPIRVGLITLQKPKLVIEQSGGKLNLQALMAQPSNEPAPQTPPTDKREPGAPLRLIINKLQVVGADVVIRPGIPGVPQEIDVPVPSVDLDNIGNADGNQNGVAIKQVIMQVAQAIASKAAESDKLPPEVKILLSGNLSQIGDQLKGMAQKQIGSVVDAVKSGDQKGMKDAAKNAQNELQGLLGGKKKESP